jgi:cyclophilin family peptidyl-prolyl cis-trans isomerase
MALHDRFGPGPHQVEIELDFPPEAPAVNGNPTTFVIELASLDDMPHSVHLFLQMVSHQLWDGCSFMRNAGHVVQASSAPYYKTTTKGRQPQLRKKFKDAGYMSVAFQEYSPKVPHEKYTVGFAGRPGGPDWYVSTRDNTKNHGPGGQSSYAVPSEADPCFGKVIQGFAAVDRMHQLPVKPGWFNAMENNVGIARATILLV